MDNKSQSSCGGVEVKQERLIDVSHEDDYSSLSNAQPPLKKLRAEVADAESNTTNSGKFHKTTHSYAFSLPTPLALLTT